MWHDYIKSILELCFTPVEILELLRSILTWKAQNIRKINVTDHVAVRWLLLVNVKLNVPRVYFLVQYIYRVDFLISVKMFLMHPANAYLSSPPTPWHPEVMSLHTFTQPSVIQQDERVVVMVASFLCPLFHFCCFQEPHTSSEGWKRKARKHWFGFEVRLCRKQVSFYFNLIIGGWIERSSSTQKI